MRLFAVVLTSLATSAALTQAASEPFSTADAHLGTLHVTSAVYVRPKSVDLMGVWQDTKVNAPLAGA